MEMGQVPHEEQAADTLLSGGPAGESGAEFVRVASLLRAMEAIPPIPEAATSDPIVARMASVIRESAAVASPQVSRRASRKGIPVRRRFFRTRVVAGLLAALLLVGGGLAFAGILPASIQTRADHLLHRTSVHHSLKVEKPTPPAPLPSPTVPRSTRDHDKTSSRSSGGGSSPGSGDQGSGGSGSGGDQSGEGNQSGGGSGSGGDQSGDGGSGSSDGSGGQGDQGSGNSTGDNQGSSS
jgi:hypothetical protein